MKDKLGREVTEGDILAMPYGGRGYGMGIHAFVGYDYTKAGKPKSVLLVGLNVNKETGDLSVSNFTRSGKKLDTVESYCVKINEIFTQDQLDYIKIALLK
jgi:hypothetical protein